MPIKIDPARPETGRNLAIDLCAEIAVTKSPAVAEAMARAILLGAAAALSTTTSPGEASETLHRLSRTINWPN